MNIIRSKRSGGANPGAALKALRQKERWTLSHVAQRTGLPISTLSRLENGKMAMTYEPSNPRYKERLAFVQAKLQELAKGDPFKIK